MKFEVCLFLALVACVVGGKAVVKLTGTSAAGQPVAGVITIEQLYEPKRVRIMGEVTGLAAGKHGFHVHQYGDIVTNGCTSTGGHYNPFGKDHAAPTEANRHVGDLGNIDVGADGKATVDITDSLITLCGRHSVVGRAIVVHAGVDDLGLGGFPDSKTTGHAGGRVACGVIGMMAP